MTFWQEGHEVLKTDTSKSCGKPSWKNEGKRILDYGLLFFLLGMGCKNKQVPINGVYVISSEVTLGIYKAVSLIKWASRINISEILLALKEYKNTKIHNTSLALNLLNSTKQLYEKI